MTWKRNILVVANVTATSDELLSTLRNRAASEPMSFEWIIPATPFAGGGEAAAQQLQDALEKCADAGLQAQGAIGHGDPLIAVTDAWDPKRHDEIIVSTLPLGVSRWLKLDLVSKARALGLPVTHVQAASKVDAMAGASS